MATLQQLLTVNTPLQNFQYLLTLLSGTGFSPTAWATGEPPEALLEVDATSLTDVQQSRYNFAAGGLLDYAGTVVAADGTTPWLTLHGDQVYNNQRFPAVAAEYVVRFTDALGLGPFPVPPGGAGVSRGQGLPVYRSINPAIVNIPNGGFVDITVRAPMPGVAGLVPDGSLTYFASGAFPGVTVTNLGPGALVAGVDEEGVGPFVTRCRTKWELLSGGATTGAYVNMALYSGAGQVTKVRTRRNVELGDPGRVDLYLANGSGPVAAGVVTAVQAFIDPIVPSGERTSSRIPETAKCVVNNSVAKTLPIAGSIAVWPEYNTPAFLAQIQDDLLRYQVDFPIGGLAVPPPLSGPSGHLPRSRVTQLLLNRSGVALGPAQELAGTLTIDGTTDPSIPFAFNEVLVWNVAQLALISVKRTV